MHKPESVLENEAEKILQDFKIQIDQLLSSQSVDVVFFYNDGFGIKQPTKVDMQSNKKQKQKQKTNLIYHIARALYYIHLLR